MSTEHSVLTCHACGGMPAVWVSKGWHQSEPVPCAVPATVVMTISTPDPIVPALCAWCVDELSECRGAAHRSA
jgi:hypothetical protein